MSRRRSLRIRLETKLGLATLLVVLGDLVVHDEWTGAASAVVGTGAVLAIAIARPAAFRSPQGLCALAAAAVFALLPVERPSPLGWLFLWVLLAAASLAPRLGGREDVLQFGIRLAAAIVRAAPAPFRDWGLARKARRRAGGRPATTIDALVRLLALPVAGGLVFAALFAAANPVIAHLFEQLRLPRLDVPRLILWAFLGVGFWLLLRPRVRPKLLRRLLSTPDLLPAAKVSTASVVLSLALFNGLFAVQNGLDLAYLWGGLGPPPGVTLAEYAHRGAYPLMFTALLAGGFVLVFLRPGSEVAKLKAARRLVVVWVAQNVFLVTSTALRTLDYIDAYSLTRLRIAALAWMALVALGLALICWRLVRGKSSSWLINANAAAAAVVLAVCSVIDLGAVAAAWNVRHFRELGTGGAELDLCYLRQLGPAAVVPMSELARRPLPPPLAARVANVRSALMADLAYRQEDWRSWTWRGERRLARAGATAGAPAPVGSVRCDGTAPASLTPPAQAGS